MRGSITNIRWQAEILTLLNLEKKPLQLRDFRAILEKNYNGWDSKKSRTLAVVLSKMLVDKKIAKVKFSELTAFYGKPEWVEKGHFKKELGFDKFKRDFKQNEKIK